MDGVLADFNKGGYEIFSTTYPEGPKIDPKNVKSFYISKEYPEFWGEKLKELYYKSGFFLNLPEIPGAKKALLEMKELGIDIKICTAPMKKHKTCADEKLEWIRNHLGHDFDENTIICRDKTFVRGDILIDDRPEVEGSLLPSWEHILYDAPYNQSVNNRRRLSWENWKNILN